MIEVDHEYIRLHIAVPTASQARKILTLHDLHNKIQTIKDEKQTNLLPPGYAQLKVS